MNITFTGNPYSGTGVVGITGTFLASAKAAKMNEDKDHKVTIMKGKWAKDRPDLKVVPTVKTAVTATSQTIGAIFKKINMSLVSNITRATRTEPGAKKIKVNEMVVANVNHANVTGPRTNNVEVKPSINDTIELFKDNQLPEVKEEPKVASVKQEAVASHTESPIEVTKQNSVPYSDLLSKDTNVINTPSRFANNQPEVSAPTTLHRREAHPNALPSRTERRSNDYANLIDNPKNIEVGKEEAILNQIASLSHNNSNSNSISADATTLEEAILEYNKIENTMKETIDNIKKLEADYKKTEIELKEQQAKQIAQVKAQTEARKEELLGLTMYGKDLQREIEEMKEMKRKMASGEPVSLGKSR